MNKTCDLFQRYPMITIITPEDFSCPINSVFNTGAALFGDKNLLLMRVEDRRGISHLTVARN